MTPSQSFSKPRLLADIGGTNARFALLRPGAAQPGDQMVLPCRDFEGPVQAARHYLSRVAGPAPNEAAFAIANPVTGDEIRMTNRSWQFSIEAARRALGLDRLLVLNDFTALALSLPLLPTSELRKLGGAASVAGAPIGLIGPGTGLGVSALIPVPGGTWVPLEGEGGHANFSPADAREADILRIVWRQHGHVSTERLVSGMGMGNLFAAIAELRGVAQPAPEPAAITERALEQRDPLCLEVLETFCCMLGTAAGNLALTLGARGGVYIGGGIVPRLGAFFDRSGFRERFESKGRFRSYLAPIPVYVILAPTPALLGAAQALAR